MSEEAIVSQGEEEGERRDWVKDEEGRMTDDFLDSAALSANSRHGDSRAGGETLICLPSLFLGKRQRLCQAGERAVHTIPVCVKGRRYPLSLLNKPVALSSLRHTGIVSVSLSLSPPPAIKF